MRVSLYARVSTDDKGQDPETQMDIIRDIAKRRGYEIEGEYIDFASGKDANRPQWKVIMTKVENNEIDGVMALRLDRVMRSVKHLCSTIEMMEKHDVRLIFSDMEFDPKNPNSALTINILSSIAEWERQIIGQRTREGLNHRKNNGATLGREKRDIPIHRIALMRINGLGWKTIATQLDIPRTTIKGREKDIAAEIDKIRGVSNDVGYVDVVYKGGVVIRYPPFPTLPRHTLRHSTLP